MFCIQCGEENDDSAKFCGACGHEIKHTKGKVTDRKESPDTEEQSKEVEPESTSKVDFLDEVPNAPGEPQLIQPKWLMTIKFLYTVFGLVSLFGIYLVFAADTSVLTFSWYGSTIITLWFIGLFSARAFGRYRKWGYAVTKLVAIVFILASTASFVMKPSLPVLGYLILVTTIYGLVIAALNRDVMRECFGLKPCKFKGKGVFKKTGLFAIVFCKKVISKSFGKKQIIFTLLVLLVISFIFLGTWTFFKNKKHAYVYEETYEYEQEIMEKYAQDFNGGKTPEETLEMYATALKAGDIEKASKYYLVNNQEDVLNQLNDLFNNDNKQFQIWIKLVESANKFDSNDHYSKFEYAHKSTEQIQVEGTETMLPAGTYTGTIVLYKISSGVWKIDTL